MILTAEMRDEPHAEGGASVICTCGWRKRHARAKVRLAAGERHRAKSGHDWAGAA
jgi:hypothetical protein